jgi:murein DD-endopeptidase MepM/ murein hydrolase activator NlpD
MEFTRPQQPIYPQPGERAVAAACRRHWTEQVRYVVGLALAVLAMAMPAHAENDRFDWPLRPRPAVVRDFDAPTPNWNRGHRGVDLAGVENQAVFTAGRGTVVFAGQLAGRPLVSIAHPGGIRTTYEPVRPSVRAGQLVGAGVQIGTLLPGHPDCAQSVCLHWGAMWGRSAAADYVDPTGLLASTLIRLKPTGG